MIIRAVTLVCLLHLVVASSQLGQRFRSRHRFEKCDEGYFFNRPIQACDRCTTCPTNTYEEKPCTRDSDTECIECGVVDHENEDFKLKCQPGIDEDLKDAIEAQFRGQLERTFALKEVKLPKEDETDSNVEKELRKINVQKFMDRAIVKPWDEDPSEFVDDDETEEQEEDDVAFVINNLEIEDSEEEPQPKIGEGAEPVEVVELRSRVQPRKGLAVGGGKRDWKEFLDNFDEDDDEEDIKPVEVDETKDGEEDGDDDSSDYEEIEAKIQEFRRRTEADDELLLIELEENDRRLVSFEETDEDREPFPELLPKKIQKRPIPAVRLIDPLFDLDEEEEKLTKVEAESDSDSSSDSDEIDDDLLFKPQADFQTWKQQRRGGVLNRPAFSEDDTVVLGETMSRDYESTSTRKHVFRALICTSFFVLFAVMLLWIKQLRRRNRIYRHHISRLRYLTPEERQVIERAAGFLHEKQPMNIYENQVYETA